MIPHEYIEELTRRTDIVELVGSYVQLKRKGRLYGGLCPFHSEKTPSFYVYPDTQSFYCFGCQAAGDAISFVKKINNISSGEAIKMLASRAGMPEPQEDDKTGRLRSRVLSMNKEAARFFHACLNSTVEEARQARAYWRRRGLDDKTIVRFGLGYAPNDGQALYQYLRDKGYNQQELDASGLFKRSQSGRIYCLFWKRVMTPIFDLRGNIIAFGGRVMDDSKPKYVNSPETLVYHISETVFAMQIAKRSASRRFVLCEGYMDVIALHEAGFECAVATLGTAITPDQARILAKYTKRVIISYDSDEAGQRAADKAFRLLDEVGLDARLLKVENAKDPDEYVRKFGAEKFRQMIEGSRTRFDFVVSRTLAEHDIESEAERVKAARALCAYIATVPSSVERDIYISKLAQILSVTPDSVRRDVEISIRRRSAETKKKNHETLIRETAGLSDRVNPDFAKRPLTAKLEEAVLGMLMLHPEYAGVAVDGQKPGEGDFFTDYGRRLFSVIREAESDGGFNLGQLPERFTEDEVSRAVKLMLSREKLDDNGEAVFCDSVRRLRDSLGTGSDISDIEELLVKRREKKT